MSHEEQEPVCGRPKGRSIFAVCGKGGTGKTAFSALFSRVLLQRGVKPLLLIDADPAGGLVSAIGERVEGTLAGVRENLIRAAREAGDEQRMRLAEQLDYLLLQALTERQGYALLAMGYSTEKGCFCPANTLLRGAMDLISEPFAAILIDAEAGIEQIQRQVTRNVTRIIVLTDGSSRAGETMACIRDMVGGARLSAVANRAELRSDLNIPEGVNLLGTIPEDPLLRQFDRLGRSLWDLPEDSPALAAVREIAERMEF